MSDKLRKLIAGLSAEERAQLFEYLLEALWDSLSDSLDELPIPESHREELDRRLAACEAQPSAGAPWSEVKARLRKKP